MELSRLAPVPDNLKVLDQPQFVGKLPSIPRRNRPQDTRFGVHYRFLAKTCVAALP